MPSVPSVEKLCAHVASLKSSSEIARPLLTRGAEDLLNLQDLRIRNASCPVCLRSLLAECVYSQCIYMLLIDWY